MSLPKHLRLPFSGGIKKNEIESSRSRQRQATSAAFGADASEALFERALQETAQAMRELVRVRALVAAGAAAVPIPGMDICFDVAGLSALLGEINRAFHLAPEDMDALSEAERQRTLEAISRAGAVFAGQTPTRAFVIALIKRFAVQWFGAKAAKWVPIVGQGAAAISSGALFMMLGNAHIRECLDVRRRIRTAVLLPAPVSS